jgi:AcrR family transcriptional regulator
LFKWDVAARQRRGATTVLSRERIVLAAVALLDEVGIDGLNMRRLGQRLGTAATAVYWHVQGKDELIVLAADAVWAEIGLPDIEAIGWRAAATAMANDLHAMILRHPWIVPAMSSYLIYGPGKARHDDHALAVFEAAGFVAREVDRAAVAVFAFVLGLAVGSTAEAARRTGPPGAGDEATEPNAAARVLAIAAEYPRLRARGADWVGGDPAAARAANLAFGLEAVLDGLETRIGVQQ